MGVLGGCGLAELISRLRHDPSELGVRVLALATYFLPLLEAGPMQLGQLWDPAASIW